MRHLDINDTIAWYKSYVDYSYFYTLHLTWYDKGYNETNIKKPNTTAAEILRWIYYGAKKPVA